MAEVDAAYLNNILQSLLDHVYGCLENTVSGQPADRFMSFTRPPDDCCDYVAVWFDGIYPTKEFPDIWTGVDRCGDVRRMMRVKVKLVRPCWPVIKDNAKAPFPTPISIETAAEKLTIDANALWCCLAGGFQSGEAWFGGDSDCLYTRMESLVPDAPRGACAGMTATVLIELEGCCSSDLPGSV